MCIWHTAVLTHSLAACLLGDLHGKLHSSPYKLLSMLVVCLPMSGLGM